MKIVKDTELYAAPEKIVSRYFRYLELEYNDGSGKKEAGINELIGDLFDDDIYLLAQAIVNDSATVYERLIQSLPEYYSVVRFY